MENKVNTKIEELEREISLLDQWLTNELHELNPRIDAFEQKKIDLGVLQIKLETLQTLREELSIENVSE